MKGEHCLRNLDFDALRSLTAASLPPEAATALVDQRGEVVWQAGEQSADLNEWIRQRRQNAATQRTSALPAPPSRSELVAADIFWHDGTAAAALLVKLPLAPAPSPDARQLVQAIASGLGRELRMLSEMEDMIDDLADRYEELNLVFALDSNLRDASQAHQCLFQLLRNCVEYRRAEFTILLYPEIQYCQHYGELPQSAPPLEALVADFRNDLLPRFQRDEHVWIDNHALTMTGSQCPTAYKILAVPVKAINRGAVGLLAWIKDPSSPDFTNSSRNLLEAMAQRVELIVTGSFDPLTGLLNRSNFERSLPAYCRSAQQGHEPLFLLHLDIDYLQILNDSRGFETGDQLIREAAHLIRLSVGDQGWIAHFGGGKFYVLLKHPSLEASRQWAQALCSQFLRIPCTGFTPSLSVGLTPYSSQSSDEDALAIAKAACAHAKKQGRNRVQIYQRSEKDFLQYRNDMEWFNRIHDALNNDRLVLFGQAIREVKPAVATHHFEVLLRMLGENNDIIPPGIFLPTAERYNLMTLIDRRVIEKCFELLAQSQFLAPRHEVRLSVNLSAQSINDPEFQAFLLEKLETYPWMSEIFCFEVTETSALSDLKEGDDFLARLQSHGCQCALDDFGTGVSSFSYLKNLRVDSVKIDGSFITTLNDDPICQSIVRSIRDVAVLKGISTVAEFVENDAILQQLAIIGIDYAQGYGVHKPEPLAPLLANLSAASGPSGPTVESGQLSVVTRD